MDPISLTASVVGIVAFASKISSSISELRSLCKSLPGRIHAVGNEVADLELVLLQVNGLIEERASLPEAKYSAVPHLLKQARSKLNEVQNIINSLTHMYLKSRIPLGLLHAWRTEQVRLKELQDDIRTIKSSLNIMLGAANSYAFISQNTQNNMLRLTAALVKTCLEFDSTFKQYLPQRHSHLRRK